MPPTRSAIRTLNAPALAIFLSVVAAGTVALFIAHAHQRERLADALLERAEDLAEQEKWRQAAATFERYLNLRPRDLTAHIRHAETFDRGAPDSKPRAIELYYRAVGVAPERIDVRQRLATLLFEVGRYPQAAQAADELLNIAESDETGLRIRALALRAQAVPGGLVRREDALAALETANRRYPGDIQVAETLAEAYHQPSTDGDLEDRIRSADAVMDRLVEAGDGEAASYLARFRYRTRYGRAGAAADLEQAAALAPDRPAVLLALGGAALVRGAASEAAGRFERVIQLAPQPLAFLGLGDCHAEMGDEEEAIAAWTAGLEIAPEDPPLNLRLADALLCQKRPQEALSFLNAAERGIDQHRLESADGPSPLAAHAALLHARCCLEQGAALEAMRLLKQITVTVPPSGRPEQDQTHVQAWLLLGKTHAQRKEWEAAARAYSQVARLRPESIESHVAAILAVAASGDFEAAIGRCETLVRREDAPPRLWLTLANLQLHEQRIQPLADRRLASLRQTLAQAEEALPGAWEVALAKAELLTMESAPDGSAAAVTLLRETEKNHPRAVELWRMLVLAYEKLGVPADADRALERYAALENDQIAVALLGAALSSERGKLAAARQTLQVAEAKAAKSEQPRIWHVLADTERRAGNMVQARRYLTRAAEAEPDNVEVIQELGELALETNNFPDLERWEKRLRELEGPDGAVWRLLKARRLAAQAESVQDERFQHAIHLQREIVSHRPNWPPGIALQAMLEQRQGETRRNLAIALANQGDPKMREQALALLELAPGGDSPEDARLRAVLLSQSGASADLRDARRVIEGLIEGTGASLPAERQMLAQLCEALGDFEAAESHWQALAKESDQSTPLVKFLLRSGRFREAVEVCLQWRTPANADWAVLLAEVLRRGEVDEVWESRAEAALGEAMEQHPAHADLLFAIANCFLSHERVEEAIALLERVAELEPENYPAWNNLSMALADRGDDFDRALQCVERALELAGRPIPALVDTKAVVLLRSGRAGEAAELLRGLVQASDAGDPRLHFHLALACERSEDPAAARHALATADQRGLSEQDLTSAERGQLAGLRSRLASTASTATSRGSE